MTTIAVLAILMAFVGYFIYLYNKIIAQKQEVINANSQISVQLDRRGKVFDSLINVVKETMEYEKGVLSEIVELRSKIVSIHTAKKQKKRLKKHSQML